MQKLQAADWPLGMTLSLWGLAFSSRAAIAFGCRSALAPFTSGGDEQALQLAVRAWCRPPHSWGEAASVAVQAPSAITSVIVS
jgi:hypothetical protein